MNVQLQFICWVNPGTGQKFQPHWKFQHAQNLARNFPRDAALRWRGPMADRLQEEFSMSSTTDKIKGVANEAVGNVKQAVGKAVGSDKLAVEGALQQRKGEAQEAVGKAKDAVKKVVDRA